MKWIFHGRQTDGGISMNTTNGECARKIENFEWNFSISLIDATLMAESVRWQRAEFAVRLHIPVNLWIVCHCFRVDGTILSFRKHLVRLHGIRWCALLWPVPQRLKKRVNIGWALTLFVLISWNRWQQQQPKRCMKGDKLRCEYEIPFGIGRSQMCWKLDSKRKRVIQIHTWLGIWSHSIYGIYDIYFCICTSAGAHTSSLGSRKCWAEISVSAIGNLPFGFRVTLSLDECTVEGLF